jgi:hypothetical protein
VAAFMLSSALSWVSTIAGYKSLYTGFGLAALGVLAALRLVSKQPLHGLLIYAWEPCVLVSFAMFTNYPCFQKHTRILKISHLFSYTFQVRRRVFHSGPLFS